jgi:ketosteroid isomerase-like protein
MQKPFRFLAIAALIGLGAWGVWALFPSADRAIRSRVAELARTASFKPSDGIVPKGLKAQKVPGFFTADAVILLSAQGFEAQDFSGREAIQERALLAMRGLRGLRVEFLDVNLTFGPDKQTAIANLTCKATVSGERDFYVQELNVMFKKVDGQWLIYRVETVKTLS